MRSILQLHQTLGELVCVTNGYDLIRYLEQVRVNAAYPALIILNLRLPRLNAMETLNLLKTDDLYRLIPVVIFSTSVTPEEEKAFNALGADVFLKPTDFGNWQEIITCLDSYVDKA